MPGLGDSLQSSAKGCSNSNLRMWKFLWMEGTVLHAGCYHRSSQSKYSWLLSNLWHPCQFGMENSLRLPLLEFQALIKCKFLLPIELSYLRVFGLILCLIHSPLHLGKRQGRGLSRSSSMTHLLALLTLRILSTCSGLNCAPHPRIHISKP